MNIFPDETLTRLSNGGTDGCPPATDAIPVVLPDCQSLDSPPASSSPLQQLLFEPTIHPVSFVAKHLTETTSRVSGKRKRHGNRPHISYLIPREGFLTPRSTTLNHAVQCSGDQTSTNTNCLGLPTPKADASEAEQFASTPDKLTRYPVVRSCGMADSVASDKYLLKVPRRCGVGVVAGAASERIATVALLDLSAAQKRKSSEKLPEVSPKKQRVSWPTAAPSDVNRVAYRGASSAANMSFVTSLSRVPSTSAVSLCDGRLAATSRSNQHSAPLSKTLAAIYGSKSTKRPHISSWSADDVFAFVLSTPHASVYAKVRYHQACQVMCFIITNMPTPLVGSFVYLYSKTACIVLGETSIRQCSSDCRIPEFSSLYRHILKICFLLNKIRSVRNIEILHVYGICLMTMQVDC